MKQCNSFDYALVFGFAIIMALTNIMAFFNGWKLNIDFNYFNEGYLELILAILIPRSIIKIWRERNDLSKIYISRSKI